MSTKTQRLAALCFTRLAEALASTSEPVQRVTKWDGAGGCFPNLIRDYERYGAGARSWFKPAEMRFFKSKLEGQPLDFPALGCTLFLTSERGPGEPRGYSVRAYIWGRAEVVTISDFFDRSTSHTASDAFSLLWRVLSGQDVKAPA